MTISGTITTFDYCVYAQRLGSSRDLAWATWRQHGTEIRRADFDRAWKAARAAEELREVMQPGLARPA